MQIQKNIGQLFAVCLMLTLCACAKSGIVLEPEVDHAGDPAAEIDDLRRLPQNLDVYARRVADRPLLSMDEQKKRLARYEELFFAPWDQTRSRIKAKEAFSILGTRGKSKARGYLPGGRPWPQDQWDAMVANADRSRYPSRAEPVITVRNTMLKEVPADQPRYLPPTNPTPGAPFDMFLYAALPMGMPLFVTHATRDRRWFFVENALVGGWVLAEDVASVDQAVERTYKTGKYAAVLRDRTPLPDSQGRPYADGTVPGTPQARAMQANLGTVFPVEDTGDGFVDVLVPVRNAEGKAILRTSRLKAEEIAVMPLPLTPRNMARLTDPLMGNPYGWGGYNFDRDCSSTLRDIFTPFGLWLPRNSSSQAKAWSFVNLKGLSPTEKLARIKNEGKPFASLLWLPGHIALYIGQYHDEAVMFHNMWGIRTIIPGEKQSGRLVIGRAVITTTRPGIELSNIQNKDGLLDSMNGMAVLR